MSREDRTHWVNHLPLVLLGIRATFKTDLTCTSAELVYGTTLRLPGEFLTCTPSAQPDIPSYLEEMRKFFTSLRPVPPRQQTQRQIFTSEDLDTCTHVFLRRDTVRAPLIPPYDGPFEVISRTDKTCTVNINGRHDVVTLDRVKPAYLDSSLTDPVLLHHPSAVTPTQVKASVKSPTPQRTVTWATTTRVASRH